MRKISFNGINQDLTSFMKVLLKQYRSFTGPKKFQTRQNSCKNRSKDTSRTCPELWESKFISDNNINLKDGRENSGKQNFNKGTYLLSKKLRGNKSWTWPALHQDKFIYQISSKCHKKKTAEKKPANFFYAQVNNSSKNKSNATKVTLDLYYTKSNSCIKCQVNILQDGWEKFGKRKF